MYRSAEKYLLQQHVLGTYVLFSEPCISCTYWITPSLPAAVNEAIHRINVSYALFLWSLTMAKYGDRCAESSADLTRFRNRFAFVYFRGPFIILVGTYFYPNLYHKREVCEDGWMYRFDVCYFLYMNLRGRSRWLKLVYI